MLLLRRIATGIVIAAAMAVLFLSVYLLWNARQWDYLPLHPSYTSDLDARSQLLEDKLEIYSRRVNDMEILVIILLGITGIYTVVFILTADVNARATTRKVDRALENVKDQIGAALSELRELREETRSAVRSESKEAITRLQEIQQQTREALRGFGAKMHEGDLEAIRERIATLARSKPSGENLQELLHFESALPALELLHSLQSDSPLARIYRTLARHYEESDPARSRFYRNHAATLTPEDVEGANELAAQALEQQPPDFREARKHFEASLAVQPDQQRAKVGLAGIARVEGDLDTAAGLLESAAEATAWESSPQVVKDPMVHYALACVLAKRSANSDDLARAVSELKAAFEHPTSQLEQMFARDTEEGGDLFALANTPPYADRIDEILLNVSVGAA